MPNSSKKKAGVGTLPQIQTILQACSGKERHGTVAKYSLLGKWTDEAEIGCTLWVYDFQKQQQAMEKKNSYWWWVIHYIWRLLDSLPLPV